MSFCDLVYIIMKNDVPNRQKWNITLSKEDAGISRWTSCSATPCPKVQLSSRFNSDFPKCNVDVNLKIRGCFPPDSFRPITSGLPPEIPCSCQYRRCWDPDPLVPSVQWLRWLTERVFSTTASSTAAERECAVATQQEYLFIHEHVSNHVAMPGSQHPSNKWVFFDGESFLSLWSPFSPTTSHWTLIYKILSDCVSYNFTKTFFLKPSTCINLFSFSNIYFILYINNNVYIIILILPINK